MLILLMVPHPFRLIRSANSNHIHGVVLLTALEPDLSASTVRSVSPSLVADLSACLVNSPGFWPVGDANLVTWLLQVR